jgi:hypothetical protein
VIAIMLEVLVGSDTRKELNERSYKKPKNAIF